LAKAYAQFEANLSIGRNVTIVLRWRYPTDITRFFTTFDNPCGRIHGWALVEGISVLSCWEKLREWHACESNVLGIPLEMLPPTRPGGTRTLESHLLAITPSSQAPRLKSHGQHSRATGTDEFVPDKPHTQGQLMSPDAEYSGEDSAAVARRVW